jgi:DivIVA domain-containing protein
MIRAFAEPPAALATTPWTRFLLWASVALMVAATLGAFVNNPRVQRRIYWSGCLLGAAGAALAVSFHGGWCRSLTTFTFLVLLSVLTAFFRTPYLKVGRRIIAASRSDRRADPEDRPPPAEPHPTQHLTDADVRGAVFAKPPLGRRGYDPDQVDALLQRIAQCLDGTTRLTAQDVRGATFGPAPASTRGYHPEQVDKFLDNAAETLAARESR